MKRYAHYWFKQKGCAFPRRIAVLDCDATVISDSARPRVQTEQLTRWTLHVSELKRGVPVSLTRVRGDTVEECHNRIASLLELKGSTWLFMSPAQRVMAMTGIWELMESLVVSFAVIEDPPTVISLSTLNNGGRLLILDMRNYGIDLLPPEMTANERCQRYLDTLHAILHTLRQGRWGSLRCTAASQAVSALRTKYDVVRLHCHTHERALRLERASLHGGRCEVFRLGRIDGTVYHLDVRNLYPSLCLTLPIPVSLRRYHGDPESAKGAGEANPANCVADVTLRVSAPYFPRRQRDITVYPIGCYRTQLAGPELQRAVETGCIVRWYTGAEYTCAPLLRDFFADWLTLLSEHRSRGNVHVCGWVKRVMNGLIGKFQEPGKQWESVPDRTEHGPYGVWTDTDEDGNDVRYRNIAWHTERQSKQGESYWSMPSVGAWVTSAGRIFLWDVLQAAGWCDTWYCDTDSIICGQRGYDNLLCRGLVGTGEVGRLRLIGTHSRLCTFGIRHYVLDDQVTCAGVPRGTIKPGESRVSYWERRSIKREIALGHRPRGDMILLTQDRGEPYRHGNVADDGTVTPFEVWESD